MRQLPQESWGSRYLNKLVSIIIIVNDVIAQIKMKTSPSTQTIYYLELFKLDTKIDYFVVA